MDRAVRMTTQLKLCPTLRGQISCSTWGQRLPGGRRNKGRVDDGESRKGTQEPERIRVGNVWYTTLRDDTACLSSSAGAFDSPSVLGAVMVTVSLMVVHPSFTSDVRQST